MDIIEKSNMLKALADYADVEASKVEEISPEILMELIIDGGLFILNYSKE